MLLIAPHILKPSLVLSTPVNNLPLLIFRGVTISSYLDKMNGRTCLCNYNHAPSKTIVDICASLITTYNE